MPTTTPSVADKSGFCRKIHISVLAELTFTQRWMGLNGTFCSVPGSGVDTLQWFSGLAAWWKRPAIRPMKRAFSGRLLSAVSRCAFLKIYIFFCIFSPWVLWAVTFLQHIPSLRLEIIVFEGVNSPLPQEKKGESIHLLNVLMNKWLRSENRTVVWFCFPPVRWLAQSDAETAVHLSQRSRWEL